MSTIKIDDLRPTGAELFSDSESYMNELGDSELDIYGGRTSPVCRTIVKSIVKPSKAAWRKGKQVYSAVRQDPKGAARRVSRFISGATIWELSNPFNSF
jgi:hypothetical protein